MSHNRLYKFLIFFCIAAGLITVASCKKEQAHSAPVIMQIRAVSPAPDDSVLTRAGSGQTVVIQGSYLASTRQVYFNGYPAPFNSALLSDNNIVVTIPADMPFASLDPAELNTIKVVTAYGEVLYQFPIVPPIPIISKATNEDAVTGDRITLTGNNFFFIDKVIFPGGIEVSTNIVTNQSGTTLQVTVPPGIPTGGPLLVVSPSGVGTSAFLFDDFTTGVICNFDNVSTLDWGCPVSSDAGLFPGNTGSYAHLSQSNIPANNWDWWNGDRGIITKQKDWVPASALNDPAGNYAMKFEIYVKAPWSTGCMYIGPPPDDNWQYISRFEPWKNSPDFKTDGWVTMTVPLNLFKKKDANGTNGAGDAAVSVGDIIGNIDEVVKFMFVDDTATPIAQMDMAIDNIRVLKIK